MTNKKQTKKIMALVERMETIAARKVSRGQVNSPQVSKKSLKRRRSRARKRGNTSGISSVAAAYSKLEKNNGYKLQMLPNGDCVIKHREYVCDLSGSVNFSVVTYNINPGLQSLFTWLAGRARGWESYVFRKFDVYFDTMKSTSTNGRVMIAVDYDAADSAPQNKQDMMANEGAMDAGVWKDFCYVAPTHDLRKFGVEKFIRAGNVANTDIKTYDLGLLLLATQGCADTTAIGDVYVEYEVLLRTPQQSVSGDAVAESVKIASGGTVSKTAAFGTVPVLTGGLPVTALGNTLTFNVIGQFLISFFSNGTVFTGSNPTYTGTATVADLYGVITPTAATTAANAITVNVTAIGQTVVVDWSAVCTTLTQITGRVGVYATTNA